jgi:D-alanyl-D-alanine dipeptidase
MSLIKISEEEFGVRLDIRYATSNNVAGESFYKNSNCYLHQDAAQKLKISSKLAKNIGLQLKIFDGFRSLEAQKYLFSKFPNSGFVSNPETGAIPHCRGIAVDLTLVNAGGSELDMGTDFDDFSSKAFHDYQNLSSEVLQNRLTLLGIMTNAGWDFYNNEWWHYQLFNPRSYSKTL